MSNDGIGVAQWISAVLSFLAIGIAVGLWLAEQRRANAEKLAEQKRETAAIERVERERVQRSTRLVAAVSELHSKALDVMEHDLPPLGAMYTSWRADEGKPRELRVIDMALESVARAAADDIPILLTIASIRTILDTTIHAKHLSDAPSVEAVLTTLKRQATVLRELK